MSKPTIPQVLPLAKSVYASGNGSLHIVLDDGNVEDRHLRFCLESAEQKGDSDAAELCRALLKMSKTQRRKLYRTINA